LVAGSNWAVDGTGAPPLGVSVTIAHLTVVSLSGSETPVRITGEVAGPRVSVKIGVLDPTIASASADGFVHNTCGRVGF
jgi:hypothetical protein